MWVFLRSQCKCGVEKGKGWHGQVILASANAKHQMREGSEAGTEGGGLEVATR